MRRIEPPENLGVNTIIQLLKLSKNETNRNMMTAIIKKLNGNNARGRTQTSAFTLLPEGIIQLKLYILINYLSGMTCSHHLA